MCGSSITTRHPWWNAAATDQATDRAHRIGQNREVDVYKVVAKGTIEERIVDLQEAKRDLLIALIASLCSYGIDSLEKKICPWRREIM